MRSLEVAVAQMVVTADCRKNSEMIQELMEAAAKNGCQLIQFPEGALSGYAKSQINDWAKVDWIALDDELEAVKKAAARLNIWVVVGSAHRLPAPHRPYNSLYVISNEGTLHARYDKRVLSFTEQKDWYSAGKADVIFEVDGIKIGLALCIEIQFPELFDAYRRQGVDVVLLSSYNDDPMFEVIARAHAALNNMWIGFSTPSGEGVSSHLIGPDGSLQASTAKTALAIGAIDPQEAKWEIPLAKAKPWRQSIRDSQFPV